MKGYCITFRSVTYAQQAMGMLQRRGISGQLRRTPRWMEERGCGYCIQVRTDRVDAAVEALQAERIPYRKVYQLDGDGEAREVFL